MGRFPYPAVIPANEYRRVRWKNGAGWTREIHAEAAAGHDWAWRISIAEIEQDGPFSVFPQVGRELVLIGGNGLRLCMGGAVHELVPPYQRLRFDGGCKVSGELVDGRATAFNLMWQQDVVDAQLWHRPLVGPMLLFVDPGSTWAVHLLAGSAVIQGVPAPLAAGDTALLGADGARTRYVLDGGGEALLMKLDRRN